MSENAQQLDVEDLEVKITYFVERDGTICLFQQKKFSENFQL